MKNKKALLLSLCAIMLVAATIFGTLAYLTSQDSVTNTFTVGKVEITLDEADVNLDGTPIDGADRVAENDYKLLPGHTYTKDPIVHVAEGSEECWVFIKVVDEIAAIEDATTVADQIVANGWTALDDVVGVYYKKGVDASAAQVDLPVFTTFKIKDNVDNTTLAGYAGKTIVVTAYAIQADGLTTPEAAWTALGVA